MNHREPNNMFDPSNYYNHFYLLSKSVQMKGFIYDIKYNYENFKTLLSTIQLKL